MDPRTVIQWTPASTGGQSPAVPLWRSATGFGSVFRWGRTQQAVRWLEGPGLEPPPALWPLREQTPLSPLAEDHHFKLDSNCLTVTYREAGREVTIQLLPGLGRTRLDLESIEAWRQADGTSLPVTDEEKIEVARRTLSYFRRHLGIRLALI